MNMYSSKEWEEPTFSSPPIARIPIKTSLSNVLLMTNPWEKRDLDKKLAHIAKEKQRREKVLEWNQRHFFVQKIFDTDHKLRFTQELQNYSEELRDEKQKRKDKSKSKMKVDNKQRSEADILVVESVKSDELADCAIIEEENDMSREPQQSRRSSNLNIKSPETSSILDSVKNSESSQESPRLPFIPKAQGTGIFLPKRLENRKKRRKKNNQLSVTVDIPTRETQDDAGGEDTDTNARVAESSGAISLLPQITRSQTIVNQGILTGPVIIRSPSLNFIQRGEPEKEPNKAKEQQMLLKSMSLPQIPVEPRENATSRPADQTFVTKKNHVSYHKGGDCQSDISSVSKNDSALDLVSDITARLPMSLMIKANHNVNKVVYRRKKRWMDKARRKNESQQNLLSDPRYIKLKNTLVKC